MTQFWTELGQNRALYEKYRALRASAGFDALTPARRRVVELALVGFKLGGVELESPLRERFMAISKRQAALGQKYSENVLDATDAYELIVGDEAQLDGLLPGRPRRGARGGERGGPRRLEAGGRCRRTCR